uniref:J domain-containing protein n=1 Tax=Pyramimonas obovata TaxID=1411642 RepID=A0A7S0R5K4_9CHLO|mmetsp:Transcript_26245/g.56935  ORF Transcript_26245/g.56935 Transcript_26245/m.56935 type:complete len:301 (+) Transcript_26245:497-1399(+)
MYQGETDAGGRGPQGGRGRGRGRHPFGGRGRGGPTGGPAAFDPTAPRRNVWKRGDPPATAPVASSSGLNATAPPFRPASGAGASSSGLNASAASFKPANGAPPAGRQFPGGGGRGPRSFYAGEGESRGTKRPAEATGPSESADEIRAKIAKLEADKAAFQDKLLRASLLKKQQEKEEARRKHREEEELRAARWKKQKAQAALNAGFAKGGVFKESAERAEERQSEAAAAEAAAQREVTRVLAATSDAQCLQVGFGCDLDTVRKAYRALARSLHPDKCRVPGAKDAFQRVGQAYQNLTSGL